MLETRAFPSCLLSSFCFINIASVFKEARVTQIELVINAIADDFLGLRHCFSSSFIGKLIFSLFWCLPSQWRAHHDEAVICLVVAFCGVNWFFSINYNLKNDDDGDETLWALNEHPTHSKINFELSTVCRDE